MSGWTLIPEPQQQSQGDQGWTPVNEPKGAVRRFLERALHLPDDILEHPQSYLNPFSPAYREKGKQEVAAAKANPPTPHLTPEFITNAMQDYRSGNTAGALGDMVGPTAAIIQTAAMGRQLNPSVPIKAPNIYEGPMPSGIPTGQTTAQPGIINRAATAVANANLPPGASLLPKVTGAQKLAQLVASKTAPVAATEIPVYGNTSNAEVRGPYQPYQGDLKVTPFQQEVIANAEGSPTPSAPSTLPRVASGEGVLNKALTALDNKSLLKIAKSRGINVTQEAQLKPGAANSPLIKKIIDDFTPDELDEIRNMGMEIGRNLPVQNPNITPEAAAEAWHYKVLNQFFPDVAVPKTMAARAQATIANRTFTAADVAKESFNRARAAAESKANAVPVDDLQNAPAQQTAPKITKAQVTESGTQMYRVSYPDGRVSIIPERMLSTIQEQGGHAGGGVTSVEELNRPGVNYVVSRSGQLTYQGKAFAPESAPSGATHVTVLPDGSFRVNAGPQLNVAQTNSLKFALKKQPWLTKAQ